MTSSRLVTLVAAGFVLVACGGSANDRPAAVTESTAEASTQGAAGTPDADAAALGLRLRQIGTFTDPTFVTAPPGDRERVFVVEQGGTIRVVERGRTLARPFLNIDGRVQSGGERGLLSMAFAPDYRDSHRFYVYYTDNDGDLQIVEFTARGNRARKGSARPILSQEHSQFANHNGGQLEFGPDGFLYMGLGDGGGGGDPFESGQDLGSHLGKLLRIDPRHGHPYRAPRSNPFRGRQGTRPAVYSYGLRNPWRFSFDRKTGDLTIADVGQNAYEEVDFVRRGKGSGANFGWDVFEGNHEYEGGSAPGHVRPVIEHSHDEGFCSITGGYILRNRTYGALRGTYVYGDLCDGRLRGARLSPGGATSRRLLGPNVSELSTFGEDGRGRVYAASLGGPVYRLALRR